MVGINFYFLGLLS